MANIRKYLGDSNDEEQEDQQTIIDDLVRQAPSSVCVATFDYDLLFGTLTVHFQKRGSYEYYNVPLDEFENFAQSNSLGTYFNLYIRDQYAYERV